MAGGGGIKAGGWLLALISLFIASCSEGPRIIRDFGFTLQVLPCREKVEGLEKQTLGFIISSPGNWSGAQYSLRWFTESDAGALLTESGLELMQNTLYSLPQMRFTLVYVPLRTGRHTFTVWISDVFGGEIPTDFSMEFR